MIICAACDAQIAWVLAHPHMSDWLKQALCAANGRDPIELQNDMEILRHLVVPRALADRDRNQRDAPGSSGAMTGPA